MSYVKPIKIKVMVELRIDFTNNLYEMGKGWVGTQEQKVLFSNACVEIANKLGMEYIPENLSAAPQGINRELIEKCYFHPMNFNISCKRENTEKYIMVLRENEFLQGVTYRESFIKKTDEEIIAGVNATIRSIDNK